MIIFATSAATGLLSVSSGGGEPKVLTAPMPRTARRITYSLPCCRVERPCCLRSRHWTRLKTIRSRIDLTTGARKILIRSGSHAEYVGSGHLVYTAAGMLRAVGFDLKRLEVRSDPVPVVEQVMTTDAGEAIFAV